MHSIDKLRQINVFLTQPCSGLRILKATNVLPRVVAFVEMARRWVNHFLSDLVMATEVPGSTQRWNFM